MPTSVLRKTAGLSPILAVALRKVSLIGRIGAEPAVYSILFLPLYDDIVSLLALEPENFFASTGRQRERLVPV